MPSKHELRDIFYKYLIAKVLALYNNKLNGGYYRK